MAGQLYFFKNRQLCGYEANRTAEWFVSKNFVDDKRDAVTALFGLL